MIDQLIEKSICRLIDDDAVLQCITSWHCYKFTRRSGYLNLHVHVDTHGSNFQNVLLWIIWRVIRVCLFPDLSPLDLCLSQDQSEPTLPEALQKQRVEGQVSFRPVYAVGWRLTSSLCSWAGQSGPWWADLPLVLEDILESHSGILRHPITFLSIFQL